MQKDSIGHFIITLCLILKNLSCVRGEFTVSVDTSEPIANFTHFWKSTGFCPPLPHDESSEWYLSEDMVQNILFIGAIPHNGITQVRSHLLLDLIAVNRFVNNKPVYNFTHLDRYLYLIWGSELKPGFELMGNPSGIFHSFENKTEVYMWRDLVYQTASRYIEIFGLNYVIKWNFESWNEPGHPGTFDTINVTVNGFLNYWDACSEGLLAASARLKLGGPGDRCQNDYRSRYCWALLNHIVYGRNFFTGKIGGRVDFISIHQKGSDPDNSERLLEGEKLSIDLIHQRFPQLDKVDLVNDEGDPLVNWKKPKWWRADATYAAMVAKIVVKHQYRYMLPWQQATKFHLLSNDNGFLSYRPDFFTQRTLLARFQMNSTSPHHVQFIRKPVFTVMGLLSLLGKTQVLSVMYKDGVLFDSDGDFGVVASGGPNSSEAAVLLYHSADTHNKTGNIKVTVHLKNWLHNANTEIIWAQYNLNNLEGNPYSYWVSQEKPATPTMVQFEKLREHEDPVRKQGPTVLTSPIIQLDLLLPGVTLLHLCTKTSPPPGQVTGLVLHKVTKTQVLVVWSDSHVNSRCIKTYIVYFATVNEPNTFKRINYKDTIFTVFQYSPQQPGYPVHGYYKVVAVDYWHQFGPPSLTVKY